jgi:hypothetical protein
MENYNHDTILALNLFLEYKQKLWKFKYILIFITELLNHSFYLLFVFTFLSVLMSLESECTYTIV